MARRLAGPAWYKMSYDEQMRLSAQFSNDPSVRAAWKKGEWEKEASKLGRVRQDVRQRDPELQMRLEEVMAEHSKLAEESKEWLSSPEGMRWIQDQEAKYAQQEKLRQQEYARTGPQYSVDETRRALQVYRSSTYNINPVSGVSEKPNMDFYWEMWERKGVTRDSVKKFNVPLSGVSSEIAGGVPVADGLHSGSYVELFECVPADAVRLIHV